MKVKGNPSGPWAIYSQVGMRRSHKMGGHFGLQHDPAMPPGKPELPGKLDFSAASADPSTQILPDTCRNKIKDCQSLNP